MCPEQTVNPCVRNAHPAYLLNKMKRFPFTYVLASTGIHLTGCASSTPQAIPQLTKDFKGSPMPAEFAKSFQQGSAKNSGKTPKGRDRGQQ